MTDRRKEEGGLVLPGDARSGGVCDRREYARRAPDWPGPFAEGTPWVGFDLDGTLAHHTPGDSKAGRIGYPIPQMVDRLLEYLSIPTPVAIFTARVSHTTGQAATKALIEAWCLKHIGVVLPITCRKDYGMLILYDDRAKEVVRNTGRLAGR